MANDSRCTCGCRIFYERGTRITTTDGSAFNIPGMVVVECVNCGGISKIVGNDGERKSVIPFPSGRAAERELFVAALDAWKVDDHRAPNTHYIIHEDADLKDFERLNIPVPKKEVAAK